MAGKVSRELTWGPTCISSRCRQLSPLSAQAPPPPGFYHPTFMLWRLSTRSPATELTEPLAVGRRPQVHLSTPRGRGAVPPHDEASVGGGGRC